MGSISLAQPLDIWVLTLFATVSASVIVLFLVFGTYTRRSSVAGQLVPSQGLAIVVAPAAGVITRVNAIEGARVQIGELVAMVSMRRATAATSDTIAEIEARLKERRDSLQRSGRAQSQLFGAQQQGLHAQLANVRRELQQIDDQIIARQRQVQIAEETFAQTLQLRQQGFVSDLQLKQQESAALQQLSELQNLQRQATSSRRQIEQLAQALKEVPAQRETSNATMQRELATLEQESLETQTRRELAVIAPLEGIVAAQLSKPGKSVQAGEPLLTVLPGDGQLEAELLVPSRAVGFIGPGDKVLLRYQAYPYQKFGHHTGKVTSISRSVLPQAAVGTQTQEPVYRVVVALNTQTMQAYGKEERLNPGMVLDAEILGEKRSLIEWVFEPLYSLKGKLSDI